MFLISKKAGIGIGHAVALITVLIILIFFSLIFSITAGKKEKMNDRVFSDNEQKFMINNAFYQFFNEPVLYQGSTMPVRDFISFSLASNPEPDVFDSAARTHFIRTMPYGLTDWRVIMPGTGYLFGYLNCPPSSIAAIIPLAYHGSYETKNIQLEYTTYACVELSGPLT